MYFESVIIRREKNLKINVFVYDTEIKQIVYWKNQIVLCELNVQFLNQKCFVCKDSLNKKRQSDESTFWELMQMMKKRFYF